MELSFLLVSEFSIVGYASIFLLHDGRRNKVDISAEDSPHLVVSFLNASWISSVDADELYTIARSKSIHIAIISDNSE